jgi:ankyrin repeat protein
LSLFACADLIQQASQKNDEAALAVHLRRQEYLQADSTSSSTSQSSSRPSNLSIAPLHIASALGYDGVVRRLLESGYIVHTRDYSNHTPLFVAARNGHSSTVTLLRSAGAHLSADEVDLARYHLTRSIGQRDQNKTMQLWADAGVPLE